MFDLRRIARVLPGAMFVARGLHRLIDPELHSIEKMRRRYGARLFQPYPDTDENRYPTLFDALALRLSGLESPRILSFGCSTGAEVRALRNRLPHARITGIDANARVLSQARKADTSPLSHYAEACRVDPAQRFDAVLAMAVFRNGALEAAQPDDCSAVLPFARFEQGVAMLDACIEPGGWLAIWHAHFRFDDLPLALHYRDDGLRMDGFAPQSLLYGPDNQRISGIEYCKVLFRKQMPA